MEKVSFVVPIFNERDNIDPLCQAISAAMEPTPYPFEIILVNDGSSDDTWAEIERVSGDYPKLLGVDLVTNYGQSSALSAGIDQASGELIVLMDGDMQNDPADVPMMLDTLKEKDCDVVSGERINRKDSAISRRVPSRIANFFIRLITGVKLRDYGCALRVFRRDIALNLGLYGELHRFIPVLAVLQGARMEQVPVRHHRRKFGKSKYGMGRTFRVISDLLLMVYFKRYQNRPIHFFGTLGIITFGAGAIIDIYFLVLKTLGNDIWGKPLLLLGFLLTIGGIQIITIGIFSEILMRTYYESQHKKPYRVKRTIIRED
ncbi:MAG: glycosyltransferase [Bacteroidetes bacterium]|nr:MAG: glycosyltransferase [Bacteroidota bacterium]RLD94591.1 MAG: glycosyltransferase [Bacteroidota bacterium]